MNRLNSRRFKTLTVFLIILSYGAFAQLNDVDFLKAGAADGAKIMQAYIAPWANAFGAGLNGSWYNTAKPHKLLGFDITATLNIGIVPSSAGTFDVGSLNLTTFTGSGIAPTISGAKTSGQPISYTSGESTIATFNTPSGTNWKIIPVPTAQVGIGLPMGTELKIRYMPTMDIKNGDISLWGVGLMHSIMQYIPGHKLLPVDVSLFGGYTELQGNVPFSLQPPVDNQISPTTSFSGQKMSASVKAWNVSVIGSFSIPVLTIYGGLGYCKTETDIRLKGNIPTVDLVDADYIGQYTDNSVITNFPAIDIKNYSGLRANLGLRLKLGVITIQADYTRSQYNVLSTGLGISFR
jgi:hypothetical protein